MLIQIHAIQNHSPANLNRDDLGAPKTCYFGGVLRSRISSQCLKRSIRTSSEFKSLLGGIRTRQLAKMIAEETGSAEEARSRAEKILDLCGLKPKGPEKSKMLVFTTRQAIKSMADSLVKGDSQEDEELAEQFMHKIVEHTAAPDMALFGRMLEPDSSSKVKWEDTAVEAALQVSHAISTHEARPEVDYYVAADDVPGEDAGAGYVGEALFASACFYKYFSIHWETLTENLKNYPGNQEHLAAHTVGAFLRAAARANPTGKQNSFAAHNPPAGILVEIRDTPLSYSNAFANKVIAGERDLVSQSIAQLAQFVRDLDVGYGRPDKRFWFSPNGRYPLSVCEDKEEIALADQNFRSLDELVDAVVQAWGFKWEDVQKVVVS